MIYRIENINETKYTAELFETAYKAMSAERRERAAKLRHEEDKRLCVFSDMLLRSMLKENFGITSPEFTKAPKGKPMLTNADIHFNLSHSGSFIVCALDVRPIGVDIETKRQVHSRMLKRVCTPEELEFITGSQSSIPIPTEFLNDEMAERFLQVWTSKEAYIKYTGKGLSTELTSFSTAEKGQLKTQLTPTTTLANKVTEEYILSIVSETE